MSKSKNPWAAENSIWYNQEANKWSAENAKKEWEELVEKAKEPEPEKKDTFYRLIFYGGAKNSTHNSAFLYASKNVKKDYSDGKIQMIYATSGKDIVVKINNFSSEQIQSVDFITHGSPLAIFLILGSSLNLEITTDDVENKNLNASLYASKTPKITSSDNSEEVDIINRINYNKFTNQAKIEFHGCQTAMDVVVIDSIVENWSEYLYSAGKTESVVIGHTTKANPNIKGEETTIKEQDYRHGNRIVVQNGEIIFSTDKKGRIKFSDYKEFFK